MSELPKGWVETNLENLLIFVLGGDWGKTPDYNDNNYSETLCIRGTEFKHWNKQKGKTSVLRKIKNTSLEKRELKINDILIEISGGGPTQPVGRTVIIDKSVLNQNKDFPKVCTNFIRLARPSTKISSGYLNYYLQNFYYSGEINKYQAGSNNLRNLKFKEYIQIRIPLAPKKEQIRIANKIDSLLAKVQNIQTQLGKIPKILKRFRQSVLAAATSGELTSKLDFKERPWRKVLLKDVGLSFNYGTSSKSNKTGEIPVLRMGNIQNGKLDWESLVYTSDKKEIEKYNLESGDVLFNRTNSPELVGKTSIYRGERQAIFAGYLIRIKCGKKLNPEFLNMLLNSPMARDYCWKVKTDGVSQSNINAKKLQAFEFYLPSIEEQKEIVHRVENLFTFADKAEQQYQKAKIEVDKLTQSILAKAFRGELVPQDPNDEPAEVLLEKIKKERERIKIDLKAKKKIAKKRTIREKPMNKKSIIPINVVLKLANTPLTGQELLSASGYPSDADTQTMERFFINIRSALVNKEITVKRDNNLNQDVFELVKTNKRGRFNEN